MRLLVWSAAMIMVAALGVFFHYGRGMWVPVYQQLTGDRQTVASVLQRYQHAVDRQLQPLFQQAGVAYPPPQLRLLAVKDEKRLELWAGEPGAWRKINTYPVLAASGVAGPKLREGDKQVPEGIYRLLGLNPNSAYHLSIKLDYPNAFDWQQAKAEGREQPGSNIFIHGKAVSIGCLAIGDAAIEQLFVLVARVGLANSQIVIAPSDPRKGRLRLPEGAPGWLPGRYQRIEAEFRQIAIAADGQ